MKKIILIRHAKSAWDNPWLNDHDRPLADRGQRAAPIMGQKLVKKNIYPDQFLSSTALRAKETAILIAKEIGYPINKIALIDQLYHSSPSLMMKYLHMQKDHDNIIFLVAHNPGMTDLVNYLGYPLDNLPTAGVVGFQSSVEKWCDLKPKNASFWFYDYPKKGK